MFVQVIQGRTSVDQAEVDRLLERWEQEVKPGAKGFLGVTSGVTADGRVIAVVRFESAAAAAENAARPEQSAWWSEMEKTYDGAPTFRESSDTQIIGAPNDSAGFVQVMTATCSDRARLEELDATFVARMAELRPDLLGAVRVWFDGGQVLDVNYFTSEADARAGEAKELPTEFADLFAEFGQLMPDVEFFDLTQPRLRS